MPFTVALVGRPNVGKSTLFNRLVGKKIAIVDDTPGVTRDRRLGDASIYDMEFTAVDTAGLENMFDDSLESRMRQQTENAIAQSHVICMVTDARDGITPLDDHFAQFLRRTNRPVILLVNKCEGNNAQDAINESYALGLGEPIGISGEHGIGMPDVYNALRSHYEQWQADNPDELADDTAPTPIMNIELDEDGNPLLGEAIPDLDDPTRPIQLAIVGRPNVGKSTMINSLLGEERLLTGPEAGITRDSITVDFEWKNRPLKLVDTAGLRRRSRVDSKLEKLSGTDTRRSIQFAQVVALVLDANDMLEKQDLTIARQVIDEGRALIIVANKWDTITDKDAQLQKLSDRLQTSLPQVRGIPIITTAGIRGKNLNKMLDMVLQVYETWNQRISTSRLNTWLTQAVDANPPPLVRGRRLKIRYMTQAKTRPPTFAVFISIADEMPESYMRYLANGLRTTFNLWGIPLRLLPRNNTKTNPFAHLAKKR